MASGFVVDVIYINVDYTYVVVDIHRLYVTKGDVKHNQLNPSHLYPLMGGGGGSS